MKSKKPKLGSGERFQNLKNKLRGKVEDPGAVAASIGRKKYGKEKMAKLSARGRAEANAKKGLKKAFPRD